MARELRKRCCSAVSSRRAPTGTTSTCSRPTVRSSKRWCARNCSTPVWSPSLASLVPEAKFAHQSWVGTRLLSSRSPTTRTSCARPICPRATKGSPIRNGRAGSRSKPRTPTGSPRSAGSSARQRRSRLFRSIVAANGVSVRKGHTLLTNLVASGEVPLALDRLQLQGRAVEEQACAHRLVRDSAGDCARRTASASPRMRRIRTPRCCGTNSRSAKTGQQAAADAQISCRRTAPIETPLNRFPLRFVDATGRARRCRNGSAASPRYSARIRARRPVLAARRGRSSA